MKLCWLIVHLTFYKISKFESHVTRNDIIIMSLPKTTETMGNADLGGTKQNIHRSKGFDESYSKMYFLLNLSHFVKSYGHLCQIYQNHSPNMVMSRGFKFRKFLFFT